MPHSLQLTTVITSVASVEMNDNGTEVKNPSLLGLKSKELNNFVIAREKYDHAVQEKNAGLPLERRIIKISIKTFIKIPEDEATDDQLWVFLKDNCNQRLLESDEPIYSYMMKLILTDPSKKPEIELIVSEPRSTRK